MKRTATSIWKGSLKEGTGTLSTKSRVLSDQAYNFNYRFKDEDGRAGTNPEELIGAAHAGCFNMAFSAELGKAGFTPEKLETKATVKLEEVDEGFAITGIHLALKASIPEIEEEQFQQIANGAKKGCPVSKALASVPIELEAKLL